MSPAHRASLTLATMRAVCVGSVALVLLATFRASQGVAVPVTTDTVASPHDNPMATKAPVTFPPEVIARLVAGDPFSPSRTASSVPYRLPENPAASALGVLAVQPQQAVRLLGTIVRGSRSFAMCQLGSDPAQVVYPGQRIGALRLAYVAQGSATFMTDAGERVVLRMPQTEQLR